MPSVHQANNHHSRLPIAIKTSAVTLSLLAILIPQALLAACCKCTDPNASPDTVVCVNTTQACDALKTTGASDAIKALTCGVDLTADDCRAQSKGGKCTDAPVNEAAYTGAPTFTSSTITLGIPIPGLTLATSIPTKGGFVSVPFLAQYIAGWYRYLVGAAVIAAGIMIVYGGFLYIVGSSITKIQQGKTIIRDALIGLVLMLGAYTVLQTLNPSLLELQPLKMRDIVKIKAQLQQYMDTEGTGDQRSAEDVLATLEANIAGETPASPTDHVLDFNVKDIENEVQKKKKSGDNVGKKDVSVECEKNKDGGQCLMTAFCHPSNQVAKASRDFKASTNEGKAAKTYEDKIRILEKVIMGMYYVCITKGQCGYVQGGTAFAGTVQGYGLEGYISMVTTANGCPDCATKTGLYYTAITRFLAPSLVSVYAARIMECADKIDSTIDPFCSGWANVVYHKIIIDPLDKAGAFVGDCGMFVLRTYLCTGTDYSNPPNGKIGSFYYTSMPDSRTRKLPLALADALKQINKTDSEQLREAWKKGYDREYARYQEIYAGLAKKYDDVTALKDNPQMILSARWIDLIEHPDLMDAKGGMKFGDLVFTCCEFPNKSSNHWLMYTGGRGLPFGFIDMGGGPGSVAGLALNTLGADQPTRSLILDNTSEEEWQKKPWDKKYLKCSMEHLDQCGPLYPKDFTLMKYIHRKMIHNSVKADPYTGGVWVWRPFHDESLYGEATTPAPAVPPGP